MRLRHVLESQQFKDGKFLEGLMKEAARLEKLSKEGRLPQTMKGKVMSTLFYEPSTRTRFSFEAAMNRLGGSVIGTEDASRFSSAYKGETLQDTVRVVGKYADVIVIRHPEAGSAGIAAEHSPVPVINAGDGPAQHPTQALLDVYTIWRELGRIDDLGIAMVGDLLYGRASSSLTYIMAQQSGISFSFVSPESLRVPKGLREYLTKKGVRFEETSRLDDALRGADVVYMTRVQKERFPSEAEYVKVKGCYVLTSGSLKLMKDNSIVMHPLPRVDEISPEVDEDPRAAYFRQAENGLYVRMALLNNILGAGK